MILPLVHKNGTSKDALLEQCRKAGAKVREAMEALSEMAPHGRDYYLVPGSFEQARKEYCDRQDMLTTVYRELAAMAEGIVDMEG